MANRNSSLQGAVYARKLERDNGNVYGKEGRLHLKRNCKSAEKVKLAMDQSTGLLPDQAMPNRFSPYHPNMPFWEEPVGLEALIPVPEETATGSVSGVSPSLPPEANTCNIKDSGSPLVEVFICFYCEADFSSMEELTKHRKQCALSPKPEDMVTPVRPRKLATPNSPKSLNSSANVEKTSFAAALSLHPVSKRRSLRLSSRKQIHLDKIDVDRELPRSPTTPRTPKSLISQLNRVTSTDDISDVDSDSGKTESSEEGTAKTKMNRLLTIEISSLLGQKLMPHFIDVVDANEQKSYENYCKTPIKNNFLDRLRTRPALPKVAYRPRRCHKDYHIYKFNKSQVKEFMSKMRTGLTKKSRHLKKQMKNLSVHLNKLHTEDLIQFDVSKRQLKDYGFLSSEPVIDPEALKSVFPSVPILREDERTLRKLLGLRTSTTPIRRSLLNELNISQVVSEDTLAEVMKQQVVVYKSVLSDLTSSSPSQDESGNLSESHFSSHSVCRNKSLKHLNKENPIEIMDDSESESRNNKRRHSWKEHCDSNDVELPYHKKRKLNATPAKISKEMTGVFSCGICSFEINVTCDVQNAVKQHFAQEHDITDIEMICDSPASLVIVRSPCKKTSTVHSEPDVIDLTLDDDSSVASGDQGQDSSISVESSFSVGVQVNDKKSGSLIRHSRRTRSSSRALAADQDGPTVNGIPEKSIVHKHNINKKVLNSRKPKKVKEGSTDGVISDNYSTIRMLLGASNTRQSERLANAKNENGKNVSVNITGKAAETPLDQDKSEDTGVTHNVRHALRKTFVKKTCACCLSPDRCDSNKPSLLCQQNNNNDLHKVQARRPIRCSQSNPNIK